MGTRTGSPLTSIVAATKLFPVPDGSTFTDWIFRLPSAPLRNELSIVVAGWTSRFTRYSPIEVGDASRKGPILTQWKGCGSVKRLGNVDIATGLSGARVLNVAACPVAINTKSGGNESMGINRSREAKEDGSDERLGDHRQYKGG
jgi:hypothetical protein